MIESLSFLPLPPYPLLVTMLPCHDGFMSLEPYPKSSPSFISCLGQDALLQPRKSNQYTRQCLTWLICCVTLEGCLPEKVCFSVSSSRSEYKLWASVHTVADALCSFGQSRALLGWCCHLSRPFPEGAQYHTEWSSWSSKVVCLPGRSWALCSLYYISTHLALLQEERWKVRLVNGPRPCSVQDEPLGLCGEGFGEH